MQLNASSKVAFVALYARFLWKNGTYSCQLVFSRPKLVPNGLSQPRAELFAATMNAHIGEVVKRAFQSNHKKKAIEVLGKKQWWKSIDSQNHQNGCLCEVKI